VEPAEARRLFAAARVARLATAGPHIVPITFAVEGNTVFTAVDHKPKRTWALRRLANIAEDPRVSLLADAYSEDWSALWWARADGTAVVHAGGHPHAVELLQRRYAQYAEQPPAGPVIEVSVERWSGWSPRPAP
jgi:PPOX class probable F420-dependent enzyme